MIGAAARLDTRAVKIRSEVLSARALELRLEGWSYQNIAAELEITVDIAARYVRHELELVSFEKAELASELRNLILARNDALVESLMPKAVKGDLFAIDRLLKVHEQSARLGGAFPQAEREGGDQFTTPIIVLPAILSPDPAQGPAPGQVVQGQLVTGALAPLVEADPDDVVYQAVEADDGHPSS